MLQSLTAVPRALSSEVFSQQTAAQETEGSASLSRVICTASGSVGLNMKQCGEAKRNMGVRYVGFEHDAAWRSKEEYGGEV